jgi:hypothetical protein
LLDIRDHIVYEAHTVRRGDACDVSLAFQEIFD